jgi:short-subunit dehydrogenase
VSGTQDRMNKVPSFFKMTSDFVAEEGVKGMLKNKELVIPGKHYWFLVNILKFFPLSIIKFIGNKISGDRFK